MFLSVQFAVSQQVQCLKCCLLALTVTQAQYRFATQRKGNIKKTISVTVLCTIIMMHKGTSSSYRSVDCTGL